MTHSPDRPGDTSLDPIADVIYSRLNIDSPKSSYREDLQSLFSCDQQVAPSRPDRSLTQPEKNILRTINSSLKDWYEPWRNTYLDDGREFTIVYDLMEGLLHYEDQITSSETVLSSDRTTAIAQAVARLIDYGNAILGIHLVIRSNDDAFSETDPMRMTTIELFQTHVKAHNLREKLLYDYFRKDKPISANILGSVAEPEQISISNATQSPGGSQVSRGSLQPATVEGVPPKSPRDSTTSINSLDSGGRTPSQVSPSLPPRREIDPIDLSQSVELSHMLAIIKSGTFSACHSSTTRFSLLPRVLAKIETLLTSPTNSIKIAHCFELLDALLDTIERLPEESRDREVIMITNALLKHLVRKVYVDDRDDLVQFQHAHWTTCLLSLVRLMNPNFNGYLKQFSNLADLGAFLNDYLFVVKRLLSSSSNRSSNPISGSFDTKDDTGLSSTYPDCWIEMTLLACSTFLSSLTSLYLILRQVFSSNLNIWLAFIDCLAHFPSHEPLRQDKLLAKERQKLLADDIRRTSAEYVWISWESLGASQKQQIVEDLMEPLLRASIDLHSKHRSVLLPIFYDMMRYDYTIQYITPRDSFCGSSLTMSQRDRISSSSLYADQWQSDPLSGYQTLSQPASAERPYLSLPQQRGAPNQDGTVLTKFTHLIVGKLNNLILDLKLGDESFAKELCAAISGDLNPRYNNRNSSIGAHGDTSQFKSMAKQTSDLISEFLQICMDCRQANRLFYKHLYLLCLFKLVLFFRDKVDRIELYLTNLYKLSHLHHVAQRYVEAGYTLLEHAKSLPWSDSPLENYYRVVTKFFNISQQQLTDSSTLKIFLYNTIIEYFDQGQNWEAAVPLCKELVNYYEFKTHEYGKLAQQLDKMANFYKNINDNTGRNNPEYFRVTFYGKGFPSCLKGMTVIYRGRPYEKLGDFQSNIISKYPDAKPLSTLSKPDRSILDDPEARYLQINACSPVVDLQSKFPGADIKKVRETLLNYYRHNCCGKFQFSRRVVRPSAASTGTKQVGPVGDDNFANMWRERTTLTTNTFPGMLPFFPVYLIETSIISPIESAIEDLERTNDRLATMVNRFRADEHHTEDVRLLGQLLLGIVDAAVNGGISKYEEAFHLHAGTLSTTLTSPSSGASKPIESMASDSNNEANKLTHNNKLVGPQNEPHDIANNCSKAADVINGSASPRPSALDVAQVDKLKYLIAKQVPLLDEAIQLHRDRVAEVMRPQHEHLEATYKKLKQHITTKYYRYLPHDYSRGSSSLSSTLRSYRSLARSPRSTFRAPTECSRSPLMFPEQPKRPSISSSPISSVRASQLGSKSSPADVESGTIRQLRVETDSPVGDEDQSSSIPYRKLSEGRKSSPFLLKSEQPADIPKTRRSPPRDGEHLYEEIDDQLRPTSSGKSLANDDNQHTPFVGQPIPYARSFARPPIDGASERPMRSPTKTSNDESHYMHLINCYRSEVIEDDDDDDDNFEERTKQSVRDGRKSDIGEERKTMDGQQQSNHEVDLVSF